MGKFPLLADWRNGNAELTLGCNWHLIPSSLSHTLMKLTLEKLGAQCTYQKLRRKFFRVRAKSSEGCPYESFLKITLIQSHWANCSIMSKENIPLLYPSYAEGSRLVLIEQRQITKGQN